MACLASALMAVGGDANPSQSSARSLAGISPGPGGGTFAEVAEKVAPAVVFIEVQKGPMASDNGAPSSDDPDSFHNDMWERFFGERMPGLRIPKPRWRSVAQGSGFIISQDGHILTNDHVVRGASKLKVTMADGRHFDAKVVGADRQTDVAVIKIDAKELPMLMMANSDEIKVGQWVLAVGSPFGLPGTVTSGIVSAKGRSSMGISDYEDFIQTDAAINPGNSGGPLVNMAGDVIGVNTAILSRTGGYNGIGFAIPINLAKKISDQLVTSGSVSRGYLGAVIQNLTPELAKSFDLENTDGVLVSEVAKDSPAEKAGLKAGDVILEFGGDAAEEIGSFRSRVALASPGSKFEMVVWRDGKRQTLSIKIGELDQAAAGFGPAATHGPLGMTVEPMNKELAERWNLDGETGVVVTEVEPESPAALAGIQPGSLIQEVNRSAVRDIEEYHKAITASDQDTVLLRVKRGNYSTYVVVARNAE
jgi:serine protease Do